ncbi:MAG: AAA family ATPase [Gammaproteobacteria bacterium]|nr:AAA family ATPase [Gammaproteobacteria bacterium]
MKKILVVNPKGGCGKTTIATNLSSYYALWEVPVALVDCDPQHSSLEWLDQRPSDLNPIVGVDGSKGKLNLKLCRTGCCGCPCADH